MIFPYNLPPWMCMKEPYMFMSFLILGPKGAGNDIDAYLRPLINELNELWENGVNTYDVSTRINFQLKAVVMWTINDFSAYDLTSSWSTKGKLACLCCAKKTTHRRLHHNSKIYYMRHRRFLPLGHKWRFQKSKFDGTIEKKATLKRPSGE